jgi:hypothetical protein
MNAFEDGRTPSGDGMLAVEDSVTALRASADPRVAVVGSHGGVYTAKFALNVGLKALIANDAGHGLRAAGVRGLAFLDDFGVPAAAVHHWSARIGHGRDILPHGVISFANSAATELGVRGGMPAQQAAALLADAEAGRRVPMTSLEERVVCSDFSSPYPVVLIDSASLAVPSDEGAILITGSHGGLLGGREETALRARARGAVFNDAGQGPESRGVDRIYTLERRGVAAVAVDCLTAEIGSARSTLQSGVVSVVNSVSARLGAKVGMTVAEWVEAVVAAGDDWR